MQLSVGVLHVWLGTMFVQEGKLQALWLEARKQVQWADLADIDPRC